VRFKTIALYADVTATESWIASHTPTVLLPGNSMVDQNNKDATELAQALQRQIELAKGLGLDFAARLLAMALMEIRINLNQISPSEVEELCARIEHQPAPDALREPAQVVFLVRPAAAADALRARNKPHRDGAV